MHEATQWSERCNVMPLWRHQFVKQLRCKVFFPFLFPLLQKVKKNTSRNTGVIVSNKVARFYNVHGVYASYIYSLVCYGTESVPLSVPPSDRHKPVFYQNVINAAALKPTGTCCLSNAFDRLSNKHYCVLSNSGLSNATSKRPKFV